MLRSGMVVFHRYEEEKYHPQHLSYPHHVIGKMVLQKQKRLPGVMPKGLPRY
jgi:hypothetical protein